MRREIRNTTHQKQNRMQIQKGIPNVAELSEAVPVLRSVPGVGVVEYIRFNGELYSSAFTKRDPVTSSTALSNVSLLNNGTIGDETFPGTVSNSVESTWESTADDLASLAAKINEIIRVLRKSNILGIDGKFLDTHSV